MDLGENLSNDLFQAVADWYHFAILELAEVSGQTLTPRRIATRLAISPVEAELALARLKKLGFLELNTKTKFWKPAHDVSITKSGVPSEAIRKNHRQMLNIASAALDSVSVEMREFNSAIFALSPEQLPELRALLKTCRKSVATLAANSHSNSKRIFNLSMQLFPIDQKEKETEQ